MRHVIFDFDGVLVDSEPTHERAMIAACEAAGLPYDRDQPWSRFIGLGDVECFEVIAADAGRRIDAGLVDRLRREKQAAFDALVAAGQVRPYAATVRLLHAASARAPVAVCSGSSRATVAPVLEKIGVMPMVAHLVTADDVKRTKPDPAGYMLAAHRLGVEPGRCVAIEDTTPGVRAARSAGMRVVAVGHSMPADRLAEAHAVVASAEGLTLAMLDEI